MPESTAIANDFGLYSAKELSSWLEVISVLRNIIAHHLRLWNRSLAKQETNPKGSRDKWLLNPLTDNQKKKPYGVIFVMLYLCNVVYPDNQIKAKLFSLIDSSTNIPTNMALQVTGARSRYGGKPLNCVYKIWRFQINALLFPR